MTESGTRSRRRNAEKRRLTKRSVEAVAPPAKGLASLWDDALAGFCVRVTPAGVRTYWFRYRVAGRAGWIRLGRHGDVTVDEARKLAEGFRGDVVRRVDPLAARDRDRASPTLDSLFERYCAEHADVHLKASSAATDRRRYAKHVAPVLGSHRVAEIGPDDVAALVHALRASPGSANRVRALLSILFAKAIEWGLRPEGSNPVSRVKRFGERPRDRRLTDDELQRLHSALDELVSPDGARRAAMIPAAAAAAIRLLLYTGARRGEVLGLRWSDLDFDPNRSVAHLRDSKTGPRDVSIPEQALAVLESLPRTSEWVFPTRRGDGPISLSKPWELVRRAARLPGVRVHELRHSFISTSAALGVPPSIIQRSVGHARFATTERYIHHTEDEVRAGVNRTAKRIAEIGAARAKVIPLRRGNA